MIGTGETKQDGTIFDAEIYFKGYNTVRCDRDRKGGGLACCIKRYICFSTKNIFSEKIAVIFVDLVLWQTKLIFVGIVYRPPKDTDILQLFEEILNSLDILEKETFVLGDMNINILRNGVNLLKNVNSSRVKIVISSDAKNYIEFCSILS